ncbi:type IV pilus biogenesis/stability protein PilW [Vibrio maerlii]|uniref:type IV pilus biogenesis/stability protein PilW n=1 Tax=Vibrio maerlii TaxID=2231648 RepID=UPI000E3C15EB|nr:type IV pilus biogenesis/stability protein PilW [Vibrio maerlii]
MRLPHSFTSVFFSSLLTGCITVTEGKVEMVQDTKQMAESRISLGLGYLENGNMLKARENLELAIKHAPKYYRAQLSLAHYYEKVDEPKQAELRYKKALKLAPKNGNVLNNYGTFLCKQGKFEIADEYFNRAIEQPHYLLLSSSYENAGLCALKSGDDTKAKHYFERALDYNPYRALSTLQIAQIEIDEKAYSDARIRLMKFHQQYGYRVTSLQLLSRLEAEVGNKALQQRYQNKLDQILTKQDD